ncbi:MAG: hypothetical protein IJI59_17885 [Clostridia bacterium]|nr:hypothetical protein [Clostridia bacterium]
MKKVLVLVLALAMVLGCTAAFAEKIGYTCMDGTNPFFVALEGAIREVVEANGDELISLDPQNSNEKQLNLIEDMISQGIVARNSDNVPSSSYSSSQKAIGKLSYCAA